MDRFTWGIVVGVLLLVGVGIGTAALVGSRETPPDLSTPSGTAIAFELAVERGDATTAWNLLADSARAQTTLQLFTDRLSRTPGQRSRLSVEQENVDGETVLVRLARTFPSSGGLFSSGNSYVNRQTVRVARQRGEWRVVTPTNSSLIAPAPR